MIEKELQRAIREVVKAKYIGRRIKFKTSGGEGETFKVKAYKIHSRKSIGIEKEEYEDFGVDEDVIKFVYVEFWDAESPYDAMGCVACIFTLNVKGQVGTCDGPYGFEYTVAYDTAIEMVDQIMEEYKRMTTAVKYKCIKTDTYHGIFEGEIYELTPHFNGVAQKIKGKIIANGTDLSHLGIIIPTDVVDMYFKKVKD